MASVNFVDHVLTEERSYNTVRLENGLTAGLFVYAGQPIGYMQFYPVKAAMRLRHDLGT